jgi:hypothetical protein
METNTTNNTFEEGKVYEGTITDQILTTTPVKGETMLLLTIKIEAKLKNERTMRSGRSGGGPWSAPGEACWRTGCG